jgi:hypothetical protein
MSELKNLFFRSAADVCEFANSNNVEIKHIAIRYSENHHGESDISYVAFYEEKENGETN